MLFLISLKTSCSPLFIPVGGLLHILRKGFYSLFYFLLCCCDDEHCIGHQVIIYLFSLICEQRFTGSCCFGPPIQDITFVHAVGLTQPLFEYSYEILLGKPRQYLGGVKLVTCILFALLFFLCLLKYFPLLLHLYGSDFFKFYFYFICK